VIRLSILFNVVGQLPFKIIVPKFLQKSIGLIVQKTFVDPKIERLSPLPLWDLMLQS
jgi:hypothetical protein